MSLFSMIFKGSNFKNINGSDLKDIMKNNKNILFLDVRTVSEFNSLHIPKSKNIPVHELKSKLDTLNLYKDKEIIIYCASGARSISAARILSKNGFNNVYNLKGGISSYTSIK